jgi:hypothetical protein
LKRVTKFENSGKYNQDEKHRVWVADRLALAGKFLEQGIDTRDNAAARYVLFRQASDIAAKGGDPCWPSIR